MGGGGDTNMLRIRKCVTVDCEGHGKVKIKWGRCLWGLGRQWER